MKSATTSEYSRSASISDQPAPVGLTRADGRVHAAFGAGLEQRQHDPVVRHLLGHGPERVLKGRGGFDESVPFLAQDPADEGIGLTHLESPEGGPVPALFHGDAVMVVDPPREGLSRAVRDALVQMAPQRIVYVSCAPATLARDVGELVRAGYAVDAVDLFDLFPQTHHLEAVVALQPFASVTVNVYVPAERL